MDAKRSTRIVRHGEKYQFRATLTLYDDERVKMTSGVGVESHCISSSIVTHFIFEVFLTSWRNISVKQSVDECESKDPKGDIRMGDTRSLREEIGLFVELWLGDGRFWNEFDCDDCRCECPVLISWGLQVGWFCQCIPGRRFWSARATGWGNISSQTFSESVILSVRRNRHWFWSRFECVSPSSSFSPGPGPILTSALATPECSQIYLFPALCCDCCSLRTEKFKRKSVSRDKLELENVAIPQEVVLSHPTTTRRSPFWASRPRGPLTNLYQSTAWVAIYFPSLEKLLRSSEYAPSGIVRIAPSDADDSKIRSLRRHWLISSSIWSWPDVRTFICLAFCYWRTSQVTAWAEFCEFTNIGRIDRWEYGDKILRQHSWVDRVISGYTDVEEKIKPPIFCENPHVTYTNTLCSVGNRKNHVGLWNPKRMTSFFQSKIPLVYLVTSLCRSGGVCLGRRFI